MVRICACAAFLVVCTAVLHYELLRTLTFGLPRLRMPPRQRVLVLFCTLFIAHGCQTALYGAVYFLAVNWWDLGTLAGTDSVGLGVCLYFSAETFTSLGFGDVVPTGPLRLLVGVEALNGLLLIGWSASYIYLAMERFWNIGDR